MYAKNTKVSEGKSKAEIERILMRYGASGFGYLTSGNKAMIEFMYNAKRIRFVLALPLKEESQSWGYKSAEVRWEQACRQRWRAVALMVKAKLESMQSDITTFEEEFLAHVVLPGGKTFGETYIPQIEKIYESGKVPALGWSGKGEP